MDLPSPPSGTAFDFADARNKMVDSQIRPNKVNDATLLKVMRALPRERFLPAHVTAIAYIDEDVPLGGGRALMEPMVLARLVQACLPIAGERALVVGAATGYGAAVLAGCGAKVTALESDEGLLAIARPAIAEFAPSVTLVAGLLAAGWASGAPYDLILIDGAVRSVPPAIAAQLKPETGRLIAVQAREGETGKAVVGEATHAGLRTRAIFDCATPLIPELLPKPEFVF